MIPGGVAEFVASLRVGALVQQGLHQRRVAGAGRHHQRCRAAGGGVVGAVDVRQAQQLLEAPHLPGLQMPLTCCGERASGQRIAGSPFRRVPLGIASRQQRPGGPEVPVLDHGACRREVHTGQGRHPFMLAVPHRIVEQRLSRFAARVACIERLRCQVLDQRAAPRGPGHGLVLQEGVTDRLRLLGLALQFELAGLLSPFVHAGFRHHRRLCMAHPQAQQPEQRMRRVLFDQGQRLHRPRHRDIQRVHMELVELERLVGLVPCAAVLQAVALQVGVGDAVAHLGVGLSLSGHQVEQQHVWVFQALGLVHREQQRGAEDLPSGWLVLVSQHDHGVPRRLPRRGLHLRERAVPRVEQGDLAFVVRRAAHEEVALAVHRAETRLLDLEQPVRQRRDRPGVAEVGLQQLQWLALRRLARQAAPEQALQRRPTEEVGVHDLVAVAAEDELSCLLQQR